MPLRARGRAAARAGPPGYVDWRLCGQLSRLLVDGFFKGTRGESLLLPSNGRIAAPAASWFWGWARAARRSTRACSGRRCPRPRTCSTVQRWSSVALELPGRGAMPAQERAARPSSEAFTPAFRGLSVTLLGGQDRRGPRGAVPDGRGPDLLGSQSGRGMGYKVLIVEDSNASREFIASTVSQIEGTEVVCASSGFDALKLLPALPVRPDHHRHQHAGHQRARAHQLREEEPELP